MVFRSKVKEDLFQELKKFIFLYHSKIVDNTTKATDVATMLTRKIIARYVVTDSNAVLVSLVDHEGYPLFKLEFYFLSLDGVDYVTVKYSEVDGLGSFKTYALTDSEGIENILVQAIKFIPSESYLKHFLNIFKTGIPDWLD